MLQDYFNGFWEGVLVSIFYLFQLFCKCLKTEKAPTQEEVGAGSVGGDYAYEAISLIKVMTTALSPASVSKYAI